MATLNLQVAADNDDAHETDAGTAFSASAVEVYLDSTAVSTGRYNGGMRFTGVTIPNAATIDAATLDIYVTSGLYDDAYIDIHAEDEDDAVDFAATADVTSRTRTAASTAWVEDGLLVGWDTSPDFAAVIKEVVDRGGWASGQAMVILGCGKDDAANSLGIHSHDKDTGFAAKLDIDYTAAGGVTVTPPTATLTTATFSPVIKLVVIPPTRTLSLATFTPVLGLSVIPPPLALSLATFAPTITTTANVVVIPGVIALSLTAFAPTVTTTGDVTVTPGILALTLAEFAPVIKIVVTPPTLALNLQTFVPIISTPRLVTPPTASLSLAAFAPTVSAPRLVTPGVVNLSLTAFAPTVTATGDVVIIPGVLTLLLSLFAPTVFTPRVVTPGLVALSLTTLAPTITVAAAFMAVWLDSGSIALLLVLDGSMSLPQAVNDGTISIKETEDATV